MPFAVPMVWREDKDHVTDCYFCMTNLQGINHKNKHCVQYPDIPSAIQPVPHGSHLSQMLISNQALNPNLITHMTEQRVQNTG